MGRLPVLVTSTVVALAGFSQVTQGYGSEVLTFFGGERLNIVWFACALLSAVLIWTARFWPTPQSAAVLEIGGIVLMGVVIMTYIIAIIDLVGLPGTLFPLGICATVVINSLGRAVMLWRRRQWVKRVAGDG